METFYTTFDQVKDRWFDGMIITGAPLDAVDFEDVDYWEELCTIMEWSKEHVHCTMHVCWGAYAGLYYHYGIQKRDRAEKLSGVYKNEVKRQVLRCFGDLTMYFTHPIPEPWKYGKKIYWQCPSWN